MKHNTHRYLAAKSIELMRQSIDNTTDVAGDFLSSYKKGRERVKAKELQRILTYHYQAAEEASWAPDDILKDNDPYHIFKLFTDAEFPNHGLNKPMVASNMGKTYYRYAGGLPYRIDHICQEIINMHKLRDYNDHFSTKQMVYQLLLLSHYISDAHVPMHCDLRDDPPNSSSSSQPSRRGGGGKPNGKYMKSSAHAHLESLWDDAVTPVAIAEGIVRRTSADERDVATDYSPDVTFTLDDCKRDACVHVKTIPAGRLMDFVIEICITSKERGLRLFPIGNPAELDESCLHEVTREIFSDCIANHVAIWKYIWEKC